MRNLFLTIIVILSIFTQYMQFKNDRKGLVNAGLPIVYWATDMDAVRLTQVKLFRNWLKKNGYPDVDLRIDAANRGMDKMIIQGVTGVASDLLDPYTWDLPYLHSIGILENLGTVAKEFSITRDDFFPAIREAVEISGNLYGVPRNFNFFMNAVNVASFRKVDMVPPPYRMDAATFERIGKEFVSKSNKNRKRREVFFVHSVNRECLWRSLGVSWFNETLTAGGLDTPGARESFDLIKKWTYQDHLLPTTAEMSSFSVDQGLGLPAIQLLVQGHFGMILIGRHVFIQLRKLSPQVEWMGSEPVHAGYPNTLCYSRPVALYRSGKSREAAKYFLAFLKSEEFNMHVVEDTDGLPPVPSYIKRPEFLRPVGRTNEWPLHQAFARAADEIAITREVSPFVLPGPYIKKETACFDAFLSGLYTSGEASKIANDFINEEIATTIKRNSSLQKSYLAACERQKKIDLLKKAGKKIPLAWIDNPFLKRYYKDKGMTE